MLVRFGYVLLGIYIALPSVARFFWGKPNSLWGQPVSFLFYLVLFILGFSFIYLGIFKYKSIVKIWYICPNCEKMNKKLEKEEPNRCVECGVNLKKLKGFYEK